MEKLCLITKEIHVKSTFLGLFLRKIHLITEEIRYTCSKIENGLNSLFLQHKSKTYQSNELLSELALFRTHNKAKLTITRT